MKFYCLDDRGYRVRIYDKETLNYISSVDYSGLRIGDVIPQGGLDPDPYIKGYKIVEWDGMEIDHRGNINLTIVVDIVWYNH